MNTVHATTTTPTRSTAWDRFAAAVYDPFLALGERRTLAEVRRSALAGARGRVVEIGAGTGLNVPHYPAAATDLVLTEPVPTMARRLRRRAADRPGTTVVEAPAEALPFPDGSVDTVVSTLVLCTVADPDPALREIARVLAPGGQLLFVEHVLADGGSLRRWQRRLAPAWAAFAMGCRCDRDLLGAIRDRLTVEAVDRRRWAGMPPVVAPLVVGRATTRNRQEQP
jgi:ubiquinone/menaquinone biosynthesis C-methylase UbiE